MKNKDKNKFKKENSDSDYVDFMEWFSSYFINSPNLKNYVLGLFANTFRFDREECNLIKSDNDKFILINKCDLLNKVIELENNVSKLNYDVFKDIDVLTELKQNLIFDNYQSTFYSLVRLSEMLCLNIILNYYLNKIKESKKKENEKNISFSDCESLIKNLGVSSDEANLLKNMCGLITSGKVNIQNYIIFFENNNNVFLNKLDLSIIECWVLYLKVLNHLRNRFFFHFNYFEHLCFINSKNENIFYFVDLFKKTVYNKDTSFVKDLETLSNFRKEDYRITCFYSFIVNCLDNEDLEKDVCNHNSHPIHFSGISASLYLNINCFCISYLFFLIDLTDELSNL